MTNERQGKIIALLKGIETGDPNAVSVVNPEKYIQHNPQTQEGGEGLAVLFKRLSLSSPRVNIVRVFSDGDYVFAHTEYEFSSSKVGFEVFRFEGDFTVEHWDNIQPRRPANLLDKSMVDGPVNVIDQGFTEANRALVRDFVEDVLIARNHHRLDDYVDRVCYIEHSPDLSGIGESFLDLFLRGDDVQACVIQYHTLHRVLADGNFILCVMEGSLDGVHTSFYDLFRVDCGKVVEHWNTIESVPLKSLWKNDNGKF